MDRRYGLDWLRIGAFGLLILYHIGMVFVPWDYHVKTARPIEWLTVPMYATNSWRMALLFVVSGVASAALLGKLGGTDGFVRSRTVRLMVPLLFGMATIVAPQAWAEVVVKRGYPHGFGWFWTHDYFVFADHLGLTLPTWNHLWFVVYLWAYSLLLALAAAVTPTTVRAAVQRAFDRLTAGPGLVAAPVALLFALRMTLYPRYGETHGLTDDWYAHAVYGAAFLFGAAAAGSRALWPRLRDQWRPLLALGVAGYVAFLLYLVVCPETGPQPPAVMVALGRLARSVQAVGMILGLLGLADAHLNRDGPARRYLTEAVFPYYIAHQTIIVLVALWLRPLGWPPLAEFALLLAATVGGCALAGELARRSGPLRPLFGLKPAPSGPGRRTAQTGLTTLSRR